MLCAVPLPWREIPHGSSPRQKLPGLRKMMGHALLNGKSVGSRNVQREPFGADRAELSVLRRERQRVPPVAAETLLNGEAFASSVCPLLAWGTVEEMNVCVTF